MFERFTEKAIHVIMQSREESFRLGYDFVGAEHIFLGLLKEDTSIAANLLKSMGVNIKSARIEVKKSLGRGSGLKPEEVPFTPKAKRVLEIALEEADQLGHDNIDTEHLLLGFIREGING
jgi:ATP-dependent Clp protease ATP-binding subunit ClpA